MSITDELRKWVKSLYTPNSDQLKLDAYRISDRIDAEHESKVSYWQDASYKDGYDEGFASAWPNYFTDKRETLEEHGWVKLPVDADGVPIRVGDVMGLVDEPAVSRMVSSIQLAGDGWWVYVGGTGRRPDNYRHHTPTVEDVLEEFFGKANLPDGTQTRAELIAEYAAKLRLAGDGE